MKRLLLIVPLLLAVTAGAQEKVEKVRVAVDMVDGSRIFGVPALKALPIRTSYAEMAIPITNVSVVTFAAEEELPKINLANGDEIRGNLNLQALALQTVIGKHSVALKHITALHFSIDGGPFGKLGMRRDKRVRLPTIIAWEDVPKRLQETKVVVVCLVDSYDPGKPSRLGPHDRTPAQMLEKYLRGVRGLAVEKDDDGNPVSPEHLRVFIVECGSETRNWATQFAKEHKLEGYGRSIPVMFVFFNGQAAHWFSYNRSPGRDGSRLLEAVKQQLARRR